MQLLSVTGRYTVCQAGFDLPWAGGGFGVSRQAQPPFPLGGSGLAGRGPKMGGGKMALFKLSGEFAARMASITSWPCGLPPPNLKNQPGIS